MFIPILETYSLHKTCFLMSDNNDVFLAPYGQPISIFFCFKNNQHQFLKYTDRYILGKITIFVP